MENRTTVLENRDLMVLVFSFFPLPVITTSFGFVNKNWQLFHRHPVLGWKQICLIRNIHIITHPRDQFLSWWDTKRTCPGGQHSVDTDCEICSDTLTQYGTMERWKLTARNLQNVPFETIKNNHHPFAAPIKLFRTKDVCHEILAVHGSWKQWRLIQAQRDQRSQNRLKQREERIVASQRRSQWFQCEWQTKWKLIWMPLTQEERFLHLHQRLQQLQVPPLKPPVSEFVSKWLRNPADLAMEMEGVVAMAQLMKWLLDKDPLGHLLEHYGDDLIQELRIRFYESHNWQSAVKGATTAFKCDRAKCRKMLLS